MKPILFSQFAKSAGYETYDYKGSSSRNYYPGKSGIRFAVGTVSNDDKKKAHVPGSRNPELPRWGRNEALTEDYRTPLNVDLSHARNTISGTGFGKRYWQEPKNGYGI